MVPLDRPFSEHKPLYHVKNLIYLEFYDWAWDPPVSNKQGLVCITLILDSQNKKSSLCLSLNQCCGSASLWCGSRSFLSLWCGSDPDPTVHFDPDPEPILASAERLKTWEKCSNRPIFHTFWLSICMRIDPDTAYHGSGSPLSIWCGSMTLLRLKIGCLRVSSKKKVWRKKLIFCAFLKSLKKGVGSGVGSGSISQRYGSADPDPQQNVTDPQHCLTHTYTA